jgi:capsular polysaccharide biosynthesis protein
MEPRSNNQNLIYNAFELLRFMWDKKWILIALSAIALIVSIIVSLNITPRYRSEVILFPAASISLSKNLVETSTISMDSRDVLSFGADAEAERMLQILHSTQIRDHIIRKFDLMKHYYVDPASPYPDNQVFNAYKGNVKIRRTEFMSIEIGVLDTDPQMAADIANEIATYVDSTVHNMQKERAQEAFAIVEKEYSRSELEIRQFSDSLQKIRKLGVIDYDSQATSLNTAYANALEKGNSGAAESILNRMKILSAYGGKYVELSQKLHAEIERLELLKAKVASYKVNVEHTVPQVFIVDKAYKDDQKTLPKRSIIVVISTLSTFALTLLLLLIAENIKASK